METLSKRALLPLCFAIILIFFAEPCAALSDTINVLITDKTTNGTFAGTQVEIADGANSFDRLSGNYSVYFQNGRVTIGNSEHELPVKLSSESPIIWNGKKYYGNIYIKKESDGFIVINEVDVELYLLGVVKAEMNDKWPLEALKAQAVIARTYAASACGKHANCDVCATSHCQVYNGISGEEESIKAAVTETRGMILKWNGAPASVFYHSDSGGMVTSSAYVWGSDIPYLRLKAEPMAYVGPNTIWQSTIPMSFIESRLNASGLNLGKIESITPIKRDESGRVLTIEVRGSNGIKSMTGHKFRTIIGTDKIKSTMFEFRQGRSAYAEDVNIGQKTVVKQQLPSDRRMKIDLRDLPQDKEEKLVWLTKHRVFTTLELMEMLSKPNKIDDYVEMGIARAQGRLPMPYGTDSNQFDGNPSDARHEPAYSPSNFSMRPGTGETLVLYGRGSGHGVGLSQWGAKTLAENGWDYRKILEYYFPGTTVGQ